VLDAAGRLVREVASGEFGRGCHRMTWDGADASGAAAAPGVYFYRLTTESGSETRRMILVN
jgi:flagellar hook assembly protein FlgD